jgi:hypothetical protein
MKLLSVGSVVAVLAAAPVASADQELAQEMRSFIADTHGDVFVWSSPTPLPVAPRPQAFDVSLGTGEDANPVAVYSRCTGKTPPLYTDGGVVHSSSGCDIYRYDFATRAERKVTSVSSSRFSETQPSIWVSKIAFVRELRPTRRQPVRNAVYVGRARGAGQIRRQPTPRSPRGGQVEGVNLTGRGLFFVWRRTGLDPISHAILTRVAGRRAIELDRIGSGGAAYGQLLRPSVDGPRAYYGRLVNGRGRIWRLGLRGDRSFAVGRRIQATSLSAQPGRRFLLATSLSGRCLLNLADPPSASLCALTLTDPVKFARHRRPRGEQT